MWERSPEKKRLHFHGVFHIPEGSLSGEMEEVNSYSFATHKRQITMQNSFFLKRFGRNDFEKITDENRIGDALSYLMKYIEKSGEKIVYSRGLPQFFISDVMARTLPARWERNKRSSFFTMISAAGWTANTWAKSARRPSPKCRKQIEVLTARHNCAIIIAQRI